MFDRNATRSTLCRIRSQRLEASLGPQSRVPLGMGFQTILHTADLILDHRFTKRGESWHFRNKGRHDGPNALAKLSPCGFGCVQGLLA